MALRWGIVSAGKISHDFAAALKTHPTEKHQITAVAARSYASAKEFANNHGIEKAYEGYESLAKDPNVDVAYIGVLNPQHLPVAKLLLDHGKHVLCEKPLTINKKETKELIEYAKQKKLFLMEAIWSRCFPVYDELRKIIEAGTIGDVLQVTVDFGFPLDHVDRVNVLELGGSATLDIGVYVLQFSQYVYRGLSPVSVLPWGHLNKHGTDDRASAILTYPGGRFSMLSVNTCAQLSNTAVVCGTKGMITIPTFWCPNTLTIKPTGGSDFSEETLKFDFPASSAKYNYNNSVGLSYEAEEVRKCIQQGLLESPKVSHADSLELADLMDKLRKAAGTVFPQDG
ncbi:hypothetical protein ILUMI_26810 [Ignelater luminosus]|uniref:Trans-1,2-dihydrobenzene-1,2-diol dehydrogenase n=1 Tax=Ignelater luminosus TaxID=2038154 RepID=A0A8K0C7D1_IGNLU|nr:hypothetical protein ILUMI_26810 [Ignelater luminosus]